MALLNVHHDIIPCQSNTSLATNFNVPDWTLLSNIAGHTGFTTNFVPFFCYPQPATVIGANLRCVFSSPQTTAPVIRSAVMYYDANSNRQFDCSWASFTMPAGANVANEAVQVGQILQTWLGTAVLGMFYVTVEVCGEGVLYEARLEIGYSVS